ncbi:alpha/beta knot [Rozella allomycis CSF55]|uniref:rRNA methyltransferase 1, mitochondrial n=1 Tax=Rozella allomycis (strain CSF55) TaxID=988480 RepID=A0A4V1J020_ROZAC|nr:alpha/beta knot [Rozella allomycis CSF55]
MDKENQDLDILNLAKSINLSFKLVDEKTLRRLTNEEKSHQGVVVSCGPLKQNSVEELGWEPETNTLIMRNRKNTTALDYQSRHPVPAGRMPLVVVLEHVSCPSNMGMIIRNACCFGADAIVISRDSSPLSATTSFASGGLMELYGASRVHRASRTILGILTAARNSGWDIVNTQVHGDTVEQYRNEKRPTILLLGNEATGVSSSVGKLANFNLTIKGSPLPGFENVLDSLNVAVASGILIQSLLPKLKI